MRTRKDGDRPPGATELGGRAWREEILSHTFELYLGISRLMAALQIGPPKSPPPRNRRPARRSR